MESAQCKALWNSSECKIKYDDKVICASRGRNPENPSDRTPGSLTEQRLEFNHNGCTNTLTSVQKDNYVFEINNIRIRKLTPRECFRLMGFSDNAFNAAEAVVMVKAGIDDSAIIGFQETKHDAKGEVDWDNDTTKVDAYAAAQKKSDGTVLWSNDISKVKTQFQAVGHINWGNTSAPTNGANSVAGTAHVSGTAKVTGDWGNKRPGTTLVGELGREMCVKSSRRLRKIF